MPTYVRVRDTSGHEITVRSDLPDGHPRGIQEGQVVLDKPATTGHEPLAPKYRTALGEPLPGSKVARKRSRGRTTKPVPADVQSDNTPTTDGHVADIPTED